MLVTGLFIKMSNGATYAFVPFVNKRALGAVAGIVGAGGNVGAVAAGFLFRSEGLAMQDAFLALGVIVSFVSAFAFLLSLAVEDRTRVEAPARGVELAACSGTVFLVGAGPGAADLLTLRAARLLARADIVFHDALVPGETLALAAHAEKIAVGKRCGRHSVAQRFINKRLVDAARKHAVVIRLKGGDPLLFGRAQEELAALRAAGIACEIVPGISAAFATSAELGVSLSERGVSRSVVFVTPRVGEGERPGDWVASVLAADTAALYMAGERSGAVARELIARGLDTATPVVVVRDASLPGRQEIPIRLGALRQLDLTGLAPTLILLGEVYEERVRRAEADLGQANPSSPGDRARKRANILAPRMLSRRSGAVGAVAIVVSPDRSNNSIISPSTTTPTSRRSRA